MLGATKVAFVCIALGIPSLGLCSSPLGRVVALTGFTVQWCSVKSAHPCVTVSDCAALAL